MALDQVDVDNMKEEGEMSFLDHLEALRWHLMRSVIALVVITIVVFMAKDFVIWILNAPRYKSFLTYQFFCNMSEAMCFYPPDFTLDVRTPTEKFLTHIRVSVILALVISFPYIIWEIWRFIKPALHKKEIKAAQGIVFSCSALFATGIAFGYFIITPFALTFLANYEFGTDVEFQPNLSNYVSSIVTFTLPVGFVFQMPIAVYFLSKIGLITPEFLKKYRRHAMIIILILSALVTPPDLVTQVLIGIPLFLLYEVSITISKRVLKNKEE